MHPLSALSGSLSLKTPVLIELSTKWLTETVTIKTRLAVESQVFL